MMGFSGSPEVVEAAVPAMNFVANTDALIFDLRRNGGGSPVTIGVLSSYLFDEVVHLNDFYTRETDRRASSSHTADVEGRRYGRQAGVRADQQPHVLGRRGVHLQPQEPEARHDRRRNHVFLHGSWMHLLGNMWFLWLFGNNIEDSMTRPRFVAFYLLCGLAAALLQVVAIRGPTCRWWARRARSAA
jgi:hypothetical protein